MKNRLKEMKRKIHKKEKKNPKFKPNPKFKVLNWFGLKILFELFEYGNSTEEDK